MGVLNNKTVVWIVSKHGALAALTRQDNKFGPVTELSQHPPNHKNCWKKYIYIYILTHLKDYRKNNIVMGPFLTELLQDWPSPQKKIIYLLWSVPVRTKKNNNPKLTTKRKQNKKDIINVEKLI